MQSTLIIWIACFLLGLSNLYHTFKERWAYRVVSWWLSLIVFSTLTIVSVLVIVHLFIEAINNRG